VQIFVTFLIIIILVILDYGLSSIPLKKFISSLSKKKKALEHLL